MADTNPTSSLRVTRLEARDFKRIEALDVSPGRKSLIILRGPNEAGKTSAIDSLIATIGGKGRSPEVPVRRGAEDAAVTVELSDALRPRYQVTRSWTTEGRTWLTVKTVNDDGTTAKLTAGQTLLDSLVSDVSFDPLAFDALPKTLDHAQRGVDAQIGLDEELLQLIPRFIRDLIGLEKRAYASEEALPRFSKAGLNFGLILGFLLLLVISRRQTRPASEVLEQIFDEPATPIPGRKARVWALGVLNEAGVDAEADPVYAMKVLRQAEPRLNLIAAKVLVDTITRY